MRQKHLRLSTFLFSSCLAVLLTAGWLAFFGTTEEARREESGNGLSPAGETANERELMDEEAASVIAKSDTIALILHRDYVCGEMVEERKLLENVSPERLLEAYKDWEVKAMGNGQLVLSQQVQDLAPQCKANGFFGMTDEGLMTLFYGPPEDGRVIRVFYQIDVERLKTSLPQEVRDQLTQGIRVSNLAEYYSVLSTFSEFMKDAKNDNSQER